MPERLPLTAADCASPTSETTSEKPKKNQIRLPSPRWPNRAFPQNYAVFNPHPQPSTAGRDRGEFQGSRSARSIEVAGYEGVRPWRIHRVHLKQDLWRGWIPTKVHGRMVGSRSLSVL
jgi:hypothetical protein